MFKKSDKSWIHTIIGLVYFFFNTVLLPAPVSYTTLLSVAKVKSVLHRFGKTVGAIFIILIVYAGIHIAQGVETSDYVISWAYFLALLFSGFAAYDYLSTSNIQFDPFFRIMSIAAAILLGVGFVALYTPWNSVFWNVHQFVGEGQKVPRFQGLSYEPSHLALTLSPVVLYFLWKLINRVTVKYVLYFISVAVPVVLSVSFGFAAALTSSLLFTVLVVVVYFQKFRMILIAPLVAMLLAAVVVVSFENPLSVRIAQIMEGEDTSVNGRTWEAFMLGYQCAETQNVWWGIGLGQIKYVGEDVIRPYYAAMDPVGYSKENWHTMALPNSMAETLAIFGILGVLLKIGFQLFCFVRFRVFKNYFNLSLFFFLFVYQMMGSFILSAAEIIMWAIAFARVFPEFDIMPKSKVRL